MKQIWIQKAGPPEVLHLRELPDPIPRTGEVRIRVQVAGVNFADILGRMGIYADAPPIPYVPGYEVAGVIDAIGQGAPNLKEGEAVLATTRFGGYSDVVCVPYKQVFKRPGWMTSEDGAALPVNYLTAYQMLVVMGSLHPGDKVLIHSAAGGVGLAALDICRIVGAETYGTASPEKLDFVRARGLDHPIDYRNYDYEQVIMDLTAGKGVQIILDRLGSQHWPKNYRLLMPTGRLIHLDVSASVTGKEQSRWAQFKARVRQPFYTPTRLMNDNKGVMGVNLARLWTAMPLQQQWMAQIMAWYDEALFRPHVDKIFRLEEAGVAHHYIQDRKNMGKVLLRP
jgi:synaptic vesicle membrane protein VAT-1